YGVLATVLCPLSSVLCVLRGKLIMVKDDHDRRERHEGTPGARFRSPGWVFVVALTAVSVLVVTGCFKARVTPPEADGGGDPPAGLRLFNGWPKPDLALVLSAQMYGYLQPCGCSRPQLGGLARRYNFIHGQLMRERGWPVVAVDLGDVPPQRQGHQAILKY